MNKILSPLDARLLFTLDIYLIPVAAVEEGLEKLEIVLVFIFKFQKV